jgi:hypothetical protein
MDPTNAMRESRWRARRKAELARLREAAGSAGEIAALKQELKLAQARIQELESVTPQRRKAPGSP